MVACDDTARSSRANQYLQAEVPSLVWWNFPMTLSGDFDGSLSGGEVKRLSELSAERSPAVDLP
jgi:hypothetical protein